MEQTEAASGKGLARLVRIAIGVGILALWVASVLAHDLAGSEIFGRFFRYAHANWGGAEGRLLAERLVFGSAGAIGVAVVLATAWKVLGSSPGRRAAPELAARWAIWLGLTLAANRYLMCLQSENVHFAQYGGVAFFLALATGSPRMAFLGTVFLGFLDESYQWWILYYHDVNNHLDWPDMCLDTCGAGAGALPFASLLRIGRYAEGRENQEDPYDRKAGVLLAAGIAGLLALLLSVNLGHYPLWPTWEELDNHKPFHTFSTREGVPIFLGWALLLYTVVDERRRRVPLCVLVAGVAVLHVAVTPPRTNRPLPIHEDVPAVKIPKAKGSITIDGRLDPAEWDHAARVSLGSFAPTATEKRRKDVPGHFGEPLPTTARLLWDERALYVAFECETQDVWARKLERDDPELPGTPCVEVFLDMDGAERSYYELEVSAGNVVQDLFVYWPLEPQWVPNPPAVSFVGLNRWDSRLRSAVTVQGGECETIPAGSDRPARKLPPTRGYTVELEVPWSDLVGRFQTPAPGVRLRGNLYRVEPSRPDGPSRYMSWAPTHAPLDFHRPAFFGVLELE